LKKRPDLVVMDRPSSLLTWKSHARFLHLAYSDAKSILAAEMRIAAPDYKMCRVAVQKSASLMPRVCQADF
jgi:hypothetical protein